MGIKIIIPSYFQHLTTNLEAVEVNGSTVGGCLSDLAKKFPGMEKMLFEQNGEMLSYLAIYLNGEDAYPDELAKPVKDGDEIHILYVIGGG